MKFKYVKWHNNYDFKIGRIFKGICYNEKWVSIEGILYRKECFEEIK